MEYNQLASLEWLKTNMGDEICQISGKEFKKRVKEIKSQLLLSTKVWVDRKSPQEIHDNILRFLSHNNSGDEDEQKRNFIVLNEFLSFSVKYYTLGIAKLTEHHNALVKKIKKEKNPDINDAINEVLDYVDRNFDADEDDYYAVSNTFDFIMKNIEFKPKKDGQDRVDAKLIQLSIVFLSDVQSSSLVDIISDCAITAFSDWHIVAVKKSFFNVLINRINKYALDPENVLAEVKNIKEDLNDRIK